MNLFSHHISVVLSKNTIMRRPFFLFCISLFLLSCQNKKQSSENIPLEVSTLNEDDSQFLVYDLEGVSSIDTLSTTNIIKSFHLIPLETNENSLVDMVLDIESMNDYIIVKHGRNMLNFQIAVFGQDGKFIRNLYNIGRGPNEIAQTINSFCNQSTNEILILGFDKILICNVETGNITHCRPYESTDGSVVVSKLAPLPDGSIACLNGVDNKGNKLHPFMLFFDSNMKLLKTYSDDKKRYVERREGPVIISALTRSPYGALYRDMLNDTVFSLSGKDLIKPAFVINIPEKQKPLLSNDADREKKKAKYYYQDVFYPFESENYIFDCFYYGNRVTNVIWRKGISQPLYKLSDDRTGYWIKLDDLKLFIDFHSSMNNQIITSIPWFIASQIIDGIQPDSNPVILKINLK